MENKQKDKRNNFRKEIKVEVAGVIALSTVVGAVVGTQIKENVDSDLSKYNVDDTKYMDYIDEEDTQKIEWIKGLDKKIKDYKLLSDDKENLTESKEIELETLESQLKDELSSGKLADFYLRNIFKTKMKTAYGVEDIIVGYSNQSGEEAITIKMYDKYDVNNKKQKPDEYMDDKDEIAPIKSAVRDIVYLQDISRRNKYDDKDIEKLISVFYNMKGFSNLTFIKEGENQLYFEENTIVDLEDGEYTIYDMEYKDGEAKVINQRNIELEEGKIINQSEIEDER